MTKHHPPFEQLESLLLAESDSGPAFHHRYDEDDDAVTRLLDDALADHALADLVRERHAVASTALQGAALQAAALQGAAFQHRAPRADALEEDTWWVASSRGDRRTLSTASISAGLWSGELSSNLWVWRTGMAAWARVSEVPQFAPSAALPPAPTPVVTPVVTTPLVGAPALDEPALDETELDELEEPDGRVRRVVMGISAAVIVALFVTMYAISAAASVALP